jgi:hypothetical protein
MNQGQWIIERTECDQWTSHQSRGWEERGRDE